jgi:hypothetical protein|tara:strand:- start:2033 stop:2173 length:141 start_codon:yes stop_codon:yes gene_type:complete
MMGQMFINGPSDSVESFDELWRHTSHEESFEPLTFSKLTPVAGSVM